MDCEGLVGEGDIVSTGKGKKVDIHIRVYPDGSGQVIVRRRYPPVQPVELMCNNKEEAAGNYSGIAAKPISYSAWQGEIGRYHEKG